MIRTVRLAVLCLAAAGTARAVGMKLERDRLVNLESPDTVGFAKTRFDFQHGFQNGTLLPVADLTLVGGLWENLQLEGEGLYHNFSDLYSRYRTEWGFNVSQVTLKWAPLDQSREDWCSLAVGAGGGQSHTKLTSLDASNTRVTAYDRRLDTYDAYAVATYETPWVVPTLSLHAVSYTTQAGGDWTGAARRVLGRLVSPGASDPLGRRPAAFAPGLGVRVRAYETKAVKAHVVADYQFTSFRDPRDAAGKSYARPAWGVGVQFLYNAPHVMMLYLSNTHGDTAAESVFGGPDTFAGFRWSYRF